MFWGFSEALDLFSEYLNIFENHNEQKSCNESSNNESENDGDKLCNREINILLFGASDPRHIIKTASKMYKYSVQGMRPILNFYLMDGCAEIMARNLILLGIALENPDILNLRTKVHLFMDVYGNSLMRISSHHYLANKARSLLKAVTDNAYLKKLTPMLNFDKIKYRERDGLENAFCFWLSKDNFQIQEHWNARIRKELGTRFDYREGQFDWDLNMVLKERNASQICSQEYRYWRETGIAFTFPEYEYSKPNKTLAAGLVRNGDKFMHRGYIGDIQTGPFAAFGLKTSDERMMKSLHGENDYRSTDITERNLLELFHELLTQTSYVHGASTSRKYGSVRLKMGKCLTHHEFNMENAEEYDKSWISIDGFNIHFLSSDDILSTQANFSEQWSQFFDIAFVGHNYFTFLQDNFINILKQKSLFIIETKLLSTAAKKVINDFEEKLFNYAQKTNLKNVINYKALNTKNAFLKFKKM